MQVLGFFQSFFEGFGSVMEFMNTPYHLEIMNGFDGNIFNATFTEITFTPFTALGVSLGAILTICLGLHIWHLIKLIF